MWNVLRPERLLASSEITPQNKVTTKVMKFIWRFLLCLTSRNRALRVRADDEERAGRELQNQSAALPPKHTTRRNGRHQRTHVEDFPSRKTVTLETTNDDNNNNNNNNDDDMLESILADVLKVITAAKTTIS